MSDRTATDRCKCASKPKPRIRLASLVALLLVSIAGCAKPAPKAPSVEAGGEMLIGERLGTDANSSVLRGIPYAAPPVGDLRWRAPRELVAPEQLRGDR